MDTPEEEKKSLNFIEAIIEEDLTENKNEGRVHTRFPPEPNGYLHIGHAKSICLNFGLANEYNGLCNLRFDDTNPTKEDVEYVDSIKEDISWLGFQWDGEPKYASDYFEQLYIWAVKLIEAGKAYVDEQPQELISEQRGVPTRPGVESMYRNRPVEENLEMFEKMKNGEFETGAMILRAKIDMSSPNMHMRDPIMYRILHQEHHRTGNKWCIYPMYDWAHGQSDFIEGITHSVCTLEFEIHRPLYDWALDQVVDGNYRPRQLEFARLNLSYTVMSKRKLLELVEGEYVNGWDDPRMPTISGLRRRGFTPESIRWFADRIGVAKRDNVIDVSLLEFSVREHLNKVAPRKMAVINPVKVIITNYPEDGIEQLSVNNNPNDENAGSRDVPFTRELFIEREDFMEDPPRKFFRLGPGREVRLVGGYIIKCEDYKKDANGNVEEIYCTYDVDSKSGGSGAKRKVKGTIHWVSATKGVNVEVRLYDRLFLDEDPDGHKDKNFKEFLNPDSLKILSNCIAEPSVTDLNPGDNMQFQRLGYFCVDKDSNDDKILINRTVPLRDSWAKKK